MNHLPTVLPGAAGSLLNAERRHRDAERAAERTADVVVIGGGITGVGVALDAATRGLDVVLVEKDDLAYGTSRWSSKLVHGGLRYLAKGKVGIAWESAVERERIMGSIAPHLTHPMASLVPNMPGVISPLVGVGVRGGDTLRRMTGSTLAPPRHLDHDEARSWVPGLRTDATGGWLSWDGQLEDDARLVVAVARTAAAYGARILTHTKVTGIDADAAGSAVAVEDGITGEHWTIRAQRVVNATGAWAADVDPRVKLVRSRGTHLVVSAARMDNPSAALTVPIEGSTSRFVFAMPEQEGLVFIGLTDVATDEALDEPRADEEEISFLLDTINSGLATPLTRADVLSTYSGYRPLVAGESGSSADLSRKHAVLDGDVVSVIGGKLTTYRRMAEDAVDVLTDRPCRTRHLPLVGAQPWEPGAPRLARRFGAEANLVAAGSPRSDQPIAGSPILPAEIAWALHAEGAITADDVLDRRLRLDLMPTWREVVAPSVADALAASG